MIETVLPQGENSMVVFVTLFLDLVVGLHPVELAVNGDVAAVELRLDDQIVGVARGEPWTIDCDLGRELAPRRLVAVAFDRGEREVGRAEQWINLPRPRSQVELLPVVEGGEATRSVRVLWRSVDGSEPDAWRVTFDGELLELSDPRLIDLPPHDPADAHLLRAELAFRGSLASAEILLGGPASDVTGSELTVIPVLLAKGNKLPSPEEMAGWFRGGGRPLRVVAVDRGPSDVVMVVDQAPRVQGQLQSLNREVLDFSSAGTAARPRPSGIHHADRLRVVVPYALPVESSGAAGRPPRELFPISADLAALREGPKSVGVGDRRIAGPSASGILRATFYAAPPAGVPQRLADAVAEAGRVASAGGRGRVVIAVTGPDSRDASRFSPAVARSYLHRLQVPLLVWSPEARDGWTDWGDVEVVRGRGELFRAIRGARSLLDRQVVVWLEGRHPPQAIELTPAAASRISLWKEGRPIPALPSIAVRTVGKVPVDKVPDDSSVVLASSGQVPADTDPVIEPSNVPIIAEPAAAFAAPLSSATADLSFADSVDVDVVNVEAVVTDRQGRRVLDLDRDDFEIFEDGEKVEITHFSGPRPAPVGSTGGDSDVASGEAVAVPRPLHLMVVVDTRLRRAHRRPVVDALRQVLGAQKAPARVLLVAYDGTLDVLQDFTSDTVRLEAAFAVLESRIGQRRSAVVESGRRMAGTVSNVAQQFSMARRTRDPGLRAIELQNARVSRDQMLTELLHTGESLRRESLAMLAGLRGLTQGLGALDGRKALLYVGDQLVFSPAQELYVGIEVGNQRFGMELTAQDIARLDSEAFSLRLHEDFQEMIRAANGRGVTFYTLSPPALDHGVTAQTSLAITLRSERSASLKESLCLMSHDTGGLCQVEGTELTQLVKNVAADFGTAYSLGYASGRPRDGKFRKLDVKARRPGLRVRHREGYLAQPRQDFLRDRVTAALVYGAESDDLGTEIRLSEPEPVSGAEHVSLRLEIRLPVHRLGVLPVSAQTFQARLRLFLALADDGARATEVQEFPLDVDVRPEQLESNPPTIYVHRMNFTAEPEARRVAVGLWDEVSRVGSFLVRPIDLGEPATAESM